VTETEDSHTVSVRAL